MFIEHMDLGNLIRKKRKSLGLTLSDLAEEGISVPTISNIERGMVHSVSDEKITYLLEKLGLDEQAILQMKRSDAEEREAFEFELSIVNNLIENRVFDIARRQLSALDKQEIIDHHADLSVKLQLAKAHLYRRQSQWERAARAFRKVIQMAGEMKLDAKTNIEAEAYCYLAQCEFQGTQDYERALSHSNSALEAFDPEGDKPYLEGRIYYDKAIFHYHLEAYALAYGSIRTARKLSEKTNDMRLAIMAYNIEGSILKKQQMYKEAIPLFKKAIDVSAALYPDPGLSAELYTNLGDNYFHAKQYEEATYCYDIARNLCQKTKDQRTLALVYNSFCEVYFATKEYEKAKEYSDKALRLAKKLDTTLDYLQILLIRAKIESQQESPQVEAICREGIDLAGSTKQYEKKKSFHFILAKYYNKIGEREKFMEETRHMFDVELMIQRAREGN